MSRAATILRSLHWRRGLRAGFAVASAMVACRLLGQPMGWAALGGFEAVLVDNGGPYRSRLDTVASVLLGGALCGVVGSLVPPNLAVDALVTAAVCFAITFARVASQPIASTSVIILVIYFAGYGSSDRTLHHALANVTEYVLGGAWAAFLSLVFWPVDPFRPARLEVAACYELLAQFTAGIHAEAVNGSDPEAGSEPAMYAVPLRRELRARMELTRAALAATPARAPSRTVRARNLSVLLETADMLFAATVRMAELAELMPPPATGQVGSASALAEIAAWLSAAEHTIALALQSHPADDAASFAPEGSNRVQNVTRHAAELAAHARAADNPADAFLRPLVNDERDALENIEIAFDAIRAVWTGRERSLARFASPTSAASPAGALDALRGNWTLDSVMMRHALRMAVVGVADVLLMRAVHVSHGFWLAMTSIIVLQPYGSGTLRKSAQRVGGTVAGGLLAALLAATIHTETGIVLAVSICSVLTLATFAIDYGWYSFFLTPTFVLMSLPYLRDWRYSGTRIFTTMLGAVVSVVAMRVLWPQSLTLELGGVLSRSAAACAAYLRATLRFWDTPPDQRAAADRELLAPARRACGLTSQDAEEALDRLLLEPSMSALKLGTRTALEKESALAFTTYVRRFTQCLTTLAAVGASTPDTTSRIDALIARLDTLAGNLQSSLAPKPAGPWTLNPEPSPSGLAEQMLDRMERQAGVLERAAAGILSTPPEAPITFSTSNAPV